MSARTIKVLAAEREVLDALAKGPKSANEISEATYHAARQAWCDANGITYDPEDPPPLVKLMGFVTAPQRGLVPMASWRVDAVLRRLEKRGEVARIQIAGRRPMLWRLA